MLSFLIFLSLVFLLEKLKVTSIFKSSALVILTFLIGALLYSFSLPENSKDNIANNYLIGDKIIGVAIGIKKSNGHFLKTEFEIKQIIRNKDTIFSNGKVLLFIEDSVNKLKLNDVCLINSKLTKIGNKNNPGEFNSESYWRHKKVQYIGFVRNDEHYIIGTNKKSILAYFSQLRDLFSSILEKKLKGDQLAVAKALILGDRSSLDGEITSKFSNAGAMHVLAVSGLHVGILVQLLSYFFAFFKRLISKNRATILILIIVWIYAFTTGLSASVVRSAFMFSVLILANLSGRQYSNFNALAFSAIVILIWNPHFLFDIGFQLSFLAMLGIFLFYKPLSTFIVSKNKWIQKVIEGTMVGVAAQIMTLPLTLYYFHQFPNYFILTNIGLMVFSFLVLAFGLLLFALNFLPLINNGLVFLLSISLICTLFIVDFIDKLPGSIALGFELNSVLILIFFLLILSFHFSRQFQLFSVIKLTLVSLFIVIVTLVTTRHKNLIKSEICFFNSNEIAFYIKIREKGFVFYSSDKNNLKNINYLVSNYNKLYPTNQNNYINLFNKKTSNLISKNNTISIERVKGGFEINLNNKKLFYALSNKHETHRTLIIYAPWLNKQEKTSLKDHSIQTPI
jgi:competence protein ComEC